MEKRKWFLDHSSFLNIVLGIQELLRFRFGRVGFRVSPPTSDRNPQYTDLAKGCWSRLTIDNTMHFSIVLLIGLTNAALGYRPELHPEFQAGLAINDVPASRREHWMRVANEVCSKTRKIRLTHQAVYADGHPCPQAPFGTAIVNTTSDELVCVISNAVGTTGGEPSDSAATDCQTQRCMARSPPYVIALMFFANAV
jgi:hypothetical protein